MNAHTHRNGCLGSRKESPAGAHERAPVQGEQDGLVDLWDVVGLHGYVYGGVALSGQEREGPTEGPQVVGGNVVLVEADGPQPPEHHSLSIRPVPT